MFLNFYRVALNEVDKQLGLIFRAEPGGSIKCTQNFTG